MLPTPNANALLSLRPGAAWAMVNDDLTTLTWNDQVQSRPTDSQIVAEAQRQSAVGPVPSTISRRQFFQQLAVQNIITTQEAIGAIKSGAVPTELQTLINGLPSDQQFSATMIVMGDAEFRRTHPLVATIGTAYGLNTTQIDQFFQAAILL